MQTPSSELFMYTFSTRTRRQESILTPSVLPIRSIGAVMRRLDMCTSSLYDGVRVQNGESLRCRESEDQQELQEVKLMLRCKVVAVETFQSAKGKWSWTCGRYTCMM